MSTAKFEKLIDLIINEDNERAEQLFHEIVVEKSRDIYESLISEDEVTDMMHEVSDEMSSEEIGMEGMMEDEEAQPVNKYIAKELDILLERCQDRVEGITNRSRSGYGNNESGQIEDVIFEISGLSNGFHSSMAEGIEALQELMSGLPRIGKWIIRNLKDVGNRIDLPQLIKQETSKKSGVMEDDDEFMDNEEMDGDYDTDGEEDDEFDDEVELDDEDDEGYEEEELEDRVVDLEDKLDQLMAEFEQEFGGEEEGEEEFGSQMNDEEDDESDVMEAVEMKKVSVTHTDGADGSSKKSTVDANSGQKGMASKPVNFSGSSESVPTSPKKPTNYGAKGETEVKGAGSFKNKVGGDASNGSGKGESAPKPTKTQASGTNERSAIPESRRTTKRRI